MLGYYLKRPNADKGPGGSRGGIGRGEHGDYGLEIGNNSNADPELVAFLVFKPEIEEILKLYSEHSPLIRLTLRAMSEELDKIKTSFRS